MIRAADYASALKRRVVTPRQVAFARDLARHERLSAEALAELNRERRRAMVRFAFETIPFYRRKYTQAGIEAGDLESPDIFSKLPILDRRDIIEHEGDLVNPAYDLHVLPASTTGGSTGRPLKTYGDPRIPLAVMSWRTLGWWGVSIHENSGYLYRAVPEGWRKTLQQLLLWPTRRGWISAARMTPGAMETFYRTLAQNRAVYLVGYVGAVDVFASFLEANGYRLPSLRAVWTTSAPLPKIKRDYFERVFGCKAYTQYGSCEFYWIAAECPCQCGLHVASDIRHVEIVEGAKPVEAGQWGDVIVTDLLNRAFPLIRYRLGDRSRLLSKACPCGRPFPLMDYVHGRISDLVWTLDGTAIPGEYWTTIFDDFSEAIKSFQVHQRPDCSVCVRYEPHAGVDARAAVASVASRLKRLYGDRLPVEFAASRIDVNDNGKTRFVVSEVVR